MAVPERGARYTFGQDDVAARRLEMLDEIFRASTLSLLEELAGSRSFDVVIDLGCGPGLTTRLLLNTLRPARLFGLELADTFLKLARAGIPEAEFIRHDVTLLPLPGSPADLLFARYVLTHLPDPEARLRGWSRQCHPGGIVAVEDNAGVDTSNSVFESYLDIAGQVMRASGADLYLGGTVRPDALGLSSLIDRIVLVSAPTALTARMFRMNLSAWRTRPSAGQFSSQIARLDSALGELEGSTASGEITWRLRQLAVVR
jgi:trans-aconitate 2-methyltransferase